MEEMGVGVVDWFGVEVSLFDVCDSNEREREALAKQRQSLFSFYYMTTTFSL